MLGPSMTAGASLASPLPNLGDRRFNRQARWQRSALFLHGGANFSAHPFIDRNSSDLTTDALVCDDLGRQVHLKLRHDRKAGDASAWLRLNASLGFFMMLIEFERAARFSFDRDS